MNNAHQCYGSCNTIHTTQTKSHIMRQLLFIGIADSQNCSINLE